EVEFTAEDGVFGGQQFKLGLRVHLPDQVAKTIVEGRALAAVIDEDESPLQYVLFEKIAIHLRELRRLGAVEKNDRRLHQVGDARLRHVDRLPGEKLRP